MKNITFKGLFLLILILLLILISLIVVKKSQKSFIIQGDCSKFNYKYQIKLKYKNGYVNNSSSENFILTNTIHDTDLSFETITQRKEDYDGIQESYKNDSNLKYYKEFSLNNGMQGYAYSYYGNLKIVLNVANANNIEDSNFLSFIVLNTIIKNKNGFDIEDYENKFNSFQELIQTINYEVQESY